MKIRFLAFVLERKGTIDFEDLVDFLNQEEPTHFAFYDRIVRVTKKGDFFVGLVVSTKDQRQFCELAKEELVIEVHEIEAGRAIIDFNFFVINAKTKRGLYQHYHHSLGVKKFGELLNLHMGRLVDGRVKAALEQAEEAGSVSEKARKSIRAHHQTKVSVTQMVRPEDLSALVDQMSRVRRFRFEVASVKAEDAALFKPFRGGMLQQVRHELVFAREFSATKVKQAVLALVNSESASKGKIVGEDDDGQEQVVNLLANYDVFGEMEFEHAAKTMNLKLKDFASSPMITRLLDAAKKNSDLFEE